MNKQYKKFRIEFKDKCDNNRTIKYNNAFSFGFEENAFTNIIVPFILKSNIKTTIIPMYFDFGRSFKFYYDTILDSLNDDTKKNISDKLNLTTETTKYLTFVLPEYSFNIYIGIILVGFVYKHLKNNKLDIFKNDKIENLKKHMSITGFYSLYPSFNLTVPIETIYNTIEKMYNNNYKDINTFTLKKLSQDANKEFGEETLYYKGIIDENFKIPTSVPDATVNVLKNSDYYKNKYLKYKNKYINLKKIK